VSATASVWAGVILAAEAEIPHRDPLVVYTVVGLMIAAVALGLFFAKQR
jgi:hypothetical protein